MSAVAATQPLPAAAAGLSPARERAAREAARSFENMFVAQMLGPMFEGLSTAAPFGGGPGEAAFRSLLVDEYAKSIGRAGGIGLSDRIYAEMLKLQESASR